MEDINTSELFCIDTEQAESGFTEISVMHRTSSALLLKAKCDGQWRVLKTVRDDCKELDVFRNLQQKECDIQSRLSHPHIAKAFGMEDVKDYGRCIVMEWVDGVNLHEWLKQKPSQRERTRVLAQLIDALAYLHGQQVVHRDIKPENVMITRNGHNVKLIDFGLADMDSSSSLKQPSGTRGYISPEQAQQRDTDCRNDIYSLGCLMGDLSLGWSYKRIASHCKRPLNQRYRNMAEVKRALTRRQQWRRGFVVALMLVLLCTGAWGAYLLKKENGRPNYEKVAQFRVANMQYTSWGGLVVSAKLAEMKEREMVVPPSVTHDGLSYKLTELGFDCFRNDTLLRKLVVECEGDTMNILKGAFKGCGNLKELYLKTGRFVGIGSSLWPCRIDDLFDAHHFADVTLYVPRKMLPLYRNSAWRRFRTIKSIQ